MINQNKNLMDLAGKFHADLPDRIRKYLNTRGIPDEAIDLNLIGWNGWRITIPIFNREGELLFFKQARDPEDKGDSPKMVAWPKGHMLLGRTAPLFRSKYSRSINSLGVRCTSFLAR